MDCDDMCQQILHDVMVYFHCPTPIPIPIIVLIQIVCRSAPLGPIPMQKLQWKLVKLHLISTDVGAKMGTVAIGIGIGACIGIGVGSVETVLHVTIETNSIRIGIGIGIGIGVGQWKHTIRP